jgi:hypothetical protein
MANPFLYQTLHLENRRSGEHRAEHVTSGLRVCVFDVARRRLIRVERPIHSTVLVPLVLHIVNLAVCVRIRKVQLCEIINNQIRSELYIRRPFTYQIGLYSNNVTCVIERAISVNSIDREWRR